MFILFVIAFAVVSASNTSTSTFSSIGTSSASSISSSITTSSSSIATSSSTSQSGDCAPSVTVIRIYDHLEDESQVPIGETFYYGWSMPENIRGITAFPIDLAAYVEYDKVGGSVKEAIVGFSRSCPPMDRNDVVTLGTIPIADDNIIRVDRNDTIYFQIEAISPSTVRDLTVDVWIILSEAGNNLYGGSLAEAPNYVTVYDDKKTIWLDIEQENYYTFFYPITADDVKYFKIDLKTAGHKLFLYGKKGSLPTTSDFDWSATDGNWGSGTLVTEQSMTSGDWYISVYGENIVWPARTATFRFYTSTDDTFDQVGSAASSTLSFLLV